MTKGKLKIGKKKRGKIDNLGFRRGMSAKINPSIVCDPYDFRGKEVKIIGVHHEVATVNRGNKRGHYMVDTLIKKRMGY